METKESRPADYLHLNQNPTLCGLDWLTLYYVYVSDVNDIETLRAERANGPFPLCPTCDTVFTVKNCRIGYTVGTKEEHRVEYFEELLTEAEAKKRVKAMREIDARPGLRGAQINSDYFYERIPSPAPSNQH
jgi:hypothetical protein